MKSRNSEFRSQKPEENYLVASVRVRLRLCASNFGILSSFSSPAHEHIVNEKERASADAHVGDIENAGSYWTKADVHEVDDLSIGDAVQEVGRSAGDEQSHSE